MPPRSISKPAAWLLAIRPRTLPAAVAPVIVGSALAAREGSFNFLAALAALAGALLLQISANLANDYFDGLKGIDRPDRLGPVRVTQSGMLPPGHIRSGIILSLVMAAGAGTYLIRVGGWPILITGLAAMGAAILYSGGPYPIASHGLGDLFVFIFFGLVAVCGTYYVQALQLHGLVVIAALPIGLLITAILVVNNLRDMETDRRAGKFTLAIFIGASKTRLEYFLLVTGAYIAPILLATLNCFSIYILLPLISLPGALPLFRAIRQEPGPHLNDALAGTARLTLVYSLLLSFGLLLDNYLA
jgi:1,4-dihydroxy-2-naphthoate octaprenyltransferase